MTFKKTFRKFRKQILSTLALVLGAAVIAILGWTIHLDRKITAQFEGRRWTLPARVYAEPTELYAGLQLNADALERELQRLGYRRVDNAKDAGSYSRRGARIDFVNRRFQFWDSLQDSQKISVVAGARGIESMMSGGEDLPIFRLDPLLIGSIFPIHGEDRVIVSPDDVPPLLPAAL